MLTPEAELTVQMGERTERWEIKGSLKLASWDTNCLSNDSEMQSVNKHALTEF